MDQSQVLSLHYQVLPREEWSSELQRLEQAALEAAHKAYAPYSNFLVGAAVLLSDGTVVTGSNQENAAYPSGLCAERTALFYAGAQYPHLAVTKLVLVAETMGKRVDFISPCGACRQVMAEVSSRQGTPFEVVLTGAKQAFVIPNNKDLLPFTFDSKSLNQ